MAEEAYIMALDNTTPRSRRAILTGTLAAAAAIAVDAVARPAPAGATPIYVVLGGPNPTSGSTSISDSTDAGTALTGTAIGSAGVGILGEVHGSSQAFGWNPSKAGVYGRAFVDADAVGVHGRSALGDGMVGETDSAGKSGVYGHQSSAGGWAVNGNNDGALTNGYVGGTNGVFGQARGSTGSGVVGYSGSASPPTGPANVGVYGVAASGRGGVFKGNVAQLRLSPSMATSHPGSGAKGDLFVDTSGRLWFCKGGMTWKQLA